MKYTCKITKELQVELNRKSKTIFTIIMIGGIVGLTAYIGLSMFFENMLLKTLLLVSAIFFGFGLVFIISINKLNNTNASKNMEDTYEFFDDHLIVESYINSEKTVSVKTYFKDIVKIRETENYFFLYPNQQAAYPVPKKEFSLEDMDLLISKIRGFMKK